MLIGNKCDMANERVVKFDEGKKLADNLGKVFLCFLFCQFILNKFQLMINIFYDLFYLGLEFFETSAKENINVKSVFER